jgi:predicted secreted protein with PEFG-CTERM motif
MKKFIPRKSETLVLILVFEIFLASASLSNSSTYAQQTPNEMGLKITSPTAGQQVPIDRLIIFGTSTDNAATDCQIYINSNVLKPFKKVLATGAGGINDYSTWTFIYNGNYRIITQGVNKLTAKLTCYVNHTNLIKWYSINVIGVLDRKEEQQKQQHHYHHPSTITSNNATTTTPFLFPMPLGEYDDEGDDVAIPPKSHKNEQLKDNSLPKPKSDSYQSSSFKATLVPNNTTMKTAGIKITSATRDNILTQTNNKLIAMKNNKTITTPSNNIYALNISSKTYPVKYQITGSGNKINSIVAENDGATLLANVSSQSNGRLTIELPRNSTDSKKQGTNADDAYTVFEDHQSTIAEETTNNNQARTLAIDFDKGTEKIEIVGTHVSPEFGAVTAVMVFAVAIIGIIVVSTKYNKSSIIPKW